jgi:hypothetical protein
MIKVLLLNYVWKSCKKNYVCNLFLHYFNSNEILELWH